MLSFAFTVYVCNLLGPCETRWLLDSCWDPASINMLSAVSNYAQLFQSYYICKTVEVMERKAKTRKSSLSASPALIVSRCLVKVCFDSLFMPELVRSFHKRHGTTLLWSWALRACHGSKSFVDFESWAIAKEQLKETLGVEGQNTDQGACRCPWWKEINTTIL